MGGVLTMTDAVNQNERVLITDALLYIKQRTGFDFERRQFTRWVESGELLIDGIPQKIESIQMSSRWYITRASLDHLVAALTAATSRPQ
jgi:hypothetical protein